MIKSQANKGNKAMRTHPLIGACRCKTMRMVKGRKDYECCECNVILGKGTVHQFVQGIWGNSSLEFRTCPDCLDRWEKFIDENPNFNLTPFNHGNLNEAIAYNELQKALKDGDTEKINQAIKDFEPYAYGEFKQSLQKMKTELIAA
jgi:hypothetical protein